MTSHRRHRFMCTAAEGQNVTRRAIAYAQLSKDLFDLHVEAARLELTGEDEERRLVIEAEANGYESAKQLLIREYWSPESKINV